MRNRLLVKSCVAHVGLCRKRCLFQRRNGTQGRRASWLRGVGASISMTGWKGDVGTVRLAVLQLLEC